MRVTNAMILNRAMYDLDGLREKYMKAQDAVNGRSLQRPSEDPKRVTEAMDLSGLKMRLERSQQSAQDATEWLNITEHTMTSMIDQLQAARDVAMQAGGTSIFDSDSRESLALSVLSIREALMQSLNTQHRDQYIFAGWKSETQPFVLGDDGNADYLANSDGVITREIAPGLSLHVNVPGSDLTTDGDFVKTLSDLAEDLRMGNSNAVTADRLKEIDQALGHLTTIRSGLGVRQVQAEQYETYAANSLQTVEERLGEISGTDLEDAVVKMTEAQTAYQAALASFAKALPTSLIDYMMP